MKMSKFIFSMSIFASLFLGVCSVGAETSLGLSEFEMNELYMVVGEIETLRFTSLMRVSVGNPDIADVAEVEGDGMSVIGKNAGQTDIFYWDNNGKNQISVFVYLQQMDLIYDRTRRLLKTVGLDQVKVEKNEKEGKVVLSGGIPKYQTDIFERVKDVVLENIIDLTEEENIDDLVQIDMQVTELTTTLTKELGIDWFTGEQTINDDGTTTTVYEDNFNPTYIEHYPGFDGSVKDFFKIGDFRRSLSTVLLAKVNALVSEGKGRILSKPKLVVKSGKEASFLVGGEIPIRSTTVSTQGTTENVSYKNYGIGMMITPEIREGKIDISLNLELSDIDRANAVGENVAFSTRTAQTQLYLDDHETVVLAGLIRKATGETFRKVPYLNRVPILGLLFRSRKSAGPNEDQEIVISLTPTILRQRPVVERKNDLVVAKTKPTQTFYNPAGGYYSGIPKEMANYVNDVQRKISSAISYPDEAVPYGWEGTVKLGLLILQDGTLAYVSIRESSGYDIFDKTAIDTARNKIGSYGPFPSDTNLQELDITIPIVYSLGNR